MTEIRSEENIRIAPFTSMKVGGIVKRLYRPDSEAGFLASLADCRRYSDRLLVVGNASNLLFPDEGFDGSVILTGGIRSLSFDETGEKVVASCGVSLTALSCFARDAGRAGLTFAYGIPGTVGGGVYMNAGAYGGQIGDVLSGAHCVDRGGKEVFLSASELCLSYRHSLLMEKELFVLSAVFDCPAGDKDALTAEMERNLQARKAKQPLEYPSCGSVFKRPEGHFAGALIEQAGLKGLSVGGARVSEKHAGFIVNTGGATANDVKALIALVQERVFACSGVRLEPEVRIVEADG